MKKTGKALIGVLSVAALVGTGVATWAINGGITTETTGPIDPIIAKVGTRDIAIDVTASDTGIRFDEPDLQDLMVKYNVKASAGVEAAEGFNPYGYDFSKVAPEYRPNLVVTTQVLRNQVEVTKDDAFFKYVEVPSITIPYTTWLDDTYDDPEGTGYPVELEFKWSSEKPLYGQNPQNYADGLGDTAEQEKFFNELTTALNGVQFKFTFTVGGAPETPVETPDTGEITIPTVEGSTLTIDGMTETTVEAGTHRITITTEEGKEVTDKKLTVIENGTTRNDFTLTEETLTGASGHTYYIDYEFKADTTYSFEYTLKDDTLYTVTYTQPENGIITLKNGDADVADGAQVEENTNLTLTVAANEGYHITSVLVNDKEAGSDYTTTFTKEIPVTANLTISATMEADPIETKSLKDLVAEKNTTEEITVLGKVVSVNYSGIVIYDGEVFVPVYLGSGKAADYKIDEYYNITGKLNNRYDWMQFNNGSGDITIEKVNEPQKVIETPEAITLTEEIAANFYGKPVQIEAKLVTFSAKAVFDGNYVNFYVEEGGTKLSFVSLPNAIRDTFVEGTTYKINAILNNNNTNGEYLSLDYISHEAVYEPVESVSITNTETELEVGKTLKLTSKVLPETANQEVTYSITSGEEFAKLEGDTLTALAKGEVEVLVKTTNEMITNTYNLSIISATSEEEAIYTYDYGENVEFASSNHNESGESIILDAINYTIEGEVTDGIIESIEIGTGENGAVYANKAHNNLGIKLGSGSKVGHLTLNLNTMVTSMDIKVVGWKGKKSEIIVNDQLAVISTCDGITRNSFTFEFEEPTNKIVICNSGKDKAFGITYMAFFN